MTGIFTGRLAKDYRNMAVLSDTISVLATASEPQALAVEVVKGLYAAMKPERVGLFEWPADDKPTLRAGLTRSGSPVPTLAIDDTEREQISIARARRRTVEAHSGSGADEVLKFAIPLLAGGDCLGVLYLAGRVRATSFDSSDLVFLEALGTQVALALDRARLTERQLQRGARAPAAAGGGRGAAQRPCSARRSSTARARWKRCSTGCGVWRPPTRPCSSPERAGRARSCSRGPCTS